MRTRSKPHGLDGLSPRATQIVRGINQHAELTAKFAEQALLCTVHKVATILIISEDLGGHPATGTLDDAHRGAGYSGQLGRARDGSLVEPLIDFLVTSQGVSTVAASSRRSIRSYLLGPSCTTQHNIKDITKNGKRHLPSDYRLGSSFWQKGFNDLEAADSLRIGSKVWSAARLTQRPPSHGSPFLSSGTSLRPLLDHSRAALREFTGDIDLDKFFTVSADSTALAQERSSLAARCTFSSWSPSSTVSSLVTEQDFEVALVISTGRIAGTGGMCRRTQRSPSAVLLRVCSQPPWSTQTPLATVSRGHGSVARCGRSLL